MIKNINNAVDYSMMEVYNGNYKMMIAGSIDNNTKVDEQETEKITQKFNSLPVYRWQM